MGFSIQIKTKQTVLISDDTEIESDINRESILVKDMQCAENETLFIEDYLMPCTPDEKVRHYLVEGSLHLYKHTRESTHKHDNVALILNIPDYMGIAQLCEYLEAYMPTIRYFRCIKQEKSKSDYMRSQMMVLLRLNCPVDDLILDFHGKPFSRIDDQICNILKVENIFIHPKLPINETMIEFPNCPVCLERIDTGTSGIMTILCNHSFHCDCLLKWGNSCPVCRNIEMKTPCAECVESNYDNAFKDVWICLICGSVGCGRYAQGHAYKHFQQSDHCFVLEIKTQRVWDYINDEFVHRLIQGDGKIVQTDPLMKLNKDQDKSKNDVALLLTTQLDSQRHYFEQLLVEKDDIIEQEKELNIKLHEKIELDFIKLSTQDKQINSLQITEKKLKQLYLDEMTMNKSLRENQIHYQKEIKDLEEQVRDLMFSLTTRDKIEHMNEEDRQELQQGSITRKKKNKKK